MRIVHRIILNADDPLWPEIEKAGAGIDRGSPIIWKSNLDDDDPAWKTLQPVLTGRPANVASKAVYSKADLEAAEFLEIIASGHHGYPQPEKDLAYIRQTYAADGLCDECGIAVRQRAPFRLRKEPGARHSDFLQLNWVFDELFVRPAAAQAMDAAGITGISWQAPVIHKTGSPSTEISQMVVETVLQPALDSEDLQPVTCKPGNEEGSPDTGDEQRTYCGRIKYHKKHIGPLRFDRAAFRSAPDVVKSAEWFGSGGSAFRLILVSQRLYQLITTAKWRGVEFEPVTLTPSL